jgi:Peptidase family C25
MEDVVELLDGSNAIPLNCTANDVVVGRYIVLSGPPECAAGEEIDVTLQAEIVANASERYDIGLFVSVDGGDSLRGECYQDYLTPVATSAGQTPNPVSGSGLYYNGELADDPADMCGDLEQGIFTYKNLDPITITCQDQDGDGIADIGTSVSWDNQTSSGSGNKPSCMDQLDTRPSTKSKCRSEPVRVGDIVVLPRIIIDKITVPADDPTVFDFTVSSSGAGVLSTFNLADRSEPYITPGLEEGTYSVAELAADGWDNVSIACDDGSDPSQIELDYGEVVTCTFYNEAIPLAAIISSFRAFSENGQTVIEWQTASESGTLGFHLERLDDEEGTYSRVNRKLLPGLLVSPQGGTYRYTDPDAVPGNTYTYRLVEKEARGGRRIYGPYTVTAVETGPDVQSADSGELEVLDVAGETLLRKARPMPSKKTSLNTALASSAFAVTSADAVQTASGAPPAGLKVSVGEDGMYRISSVDLALGLGQPESRVRRLIRRGKLAIENQGQPVAWYPNSRGRWVNFYARGIDNQYAADNIYSLKTGTRTRVQTIRGEGPQPVAMTNGFVDHIHVEQDMWAVPGLFTDPNADYWVWSYMFAHVSGYQERSFVLDVRGLLPGVPVTLGVNLQGGSDAAHLVNVRVNGVEVGQTAFSGITSHVAEINVDPGVFSSGTNTVTLTAVVPASGNSAVYVDSLDIRYERAYTASDNRLFFTGTGQEVVTVGGFSKRPIVFDVTDPANIRRVLAVTVNLGGGGDYQVSLVPAGPERQYLAIPLASYQKLDTSDWVADYSSDLRNPAHAVDYLVIAPGVLADQARRLADYRQSRGLRTKVVLLDDIHDEFNFGIASPHAVKDLLAYAWNNWAAAPRYVVRLGEGTYDYKDLQGHGENLMPPLLVSTPYGMFASENRLADVDGSNDGVPEMAMGLLPADSPAALAAMIDKIIAYEASAGEWTSRVLMVADNPDLGGNFHFTSDRVAGWVSDAYTTSSIYLEPQGFSDTRNQLLNSLNEGALLVNYMGHAALDRLAGEGLLGKTDVGNLGNGDHLPVFLGMTCSANRFEVPGYDAIGEVLATQANGGAVASWSPTGWSLNYLAQRLDEDFFLSVFQGGERILGEAVLASLEEYGYRANADERFMLDIYTLLGDPALQLR